MSFHFREGKVFFLDAAFQEWEATPVTELVTVPDERGVAQRIKLADAVLGLRKVVKDDEPHRGA